MMAMCMYVYVYISPALENGKQCCESGNADAKSDEGDHDPISVILRDVVTAGNAEKQWLCLFYVFRST
jgi:hypothetical protein